jgi:hypothetical protein
MKTIIKLEGLMDGLNGHEGLIRQHWTKRKKKQAKYNLLIKAQAKNKHLGRVSVTYKTYTTRFKDWDNYGASFKLLGDALVHNKIIVDDSPKYIVPFIPIQEKVKTKKEQRIELIIEDILN